MLQHLLIKNYALIQHLEISPSKELNIITGETGAGKSIMLGAIGLLIGNRADTKVLYDEEEKCVIEGTFDISAYNIKAIFAEEELDYEATCIIRREISPSGKSRAFINDTPVTLDSLKKVGFYLMDIHSQHDTLLLGSNAFQLQIIDAFAQNEELLKSYQVSYKAFKKAKTTFDKLLTEADEMKKEASFNQFLYEELKKANFKDGEQEEIEGELEILEHAEEIKLKLNQLLNTLSTSEFSVNTNLASANQVLVQLSKYGQKYKSLQDRVESCLIELKDITSEIEKDEEQVEYDPDKIQLNKERISLIYQLQQKHSVKTIAELLDIQSSLEEKVNKVLNLDEEISNAKQALEEAEDLMMQQAYLLSASRKAVFEKFTEEVQLLVRDLGMPDATLLMNCNETMAQNTGIDEINLLFSANKGIKPQDLKSVASGGEFSRLMFCIKFVLADKTALPTIIFDEIDTGISGEVAMKMVNMMKLMSKNHQVISISHLPQIAAKGDAHYFVYKDNSSGKTKSNIRKLTEEERIMEIAKMIGGEKPSSIAFENAKELLGVS
jgi:DNA repair protein RecN (Recombination protein N)